MIHRPELLNALEDAPVGPLTITAWRHMFGSHLPDQENNRGARWNPPGVAAIYLSHDRPGAIAEGDHVIAIQPLRPRARRKLYAVTLTLEKVIDISAPADLARMGLTADDIASDDLTACQEVGAAVDWLAYDGLIVPSARSPSLNLVIYPAHRAPHAVFEFDSGEEITS
jgi:RES domain-containing protein